MQLLSNCAVHASHITTMETKDVQIVVRLTETNKERLQETASSLKVSVGTVVREAIDLWFKKRAKGSKQPNTGGY